MMCINNFRILNEYVFQHKLNYLFINFKIKVRKWNYENDMNITLSAHVKKKDQFKTFICISPLILKVKFELLLIYS